MLVLYYIKSVERNGLIIFSFTLPKRLPFFIGTRTYTSCRVVLEKHLATFYIRISWSRLRQKEIQTNFLRLLPTDSITSRDALTLGGQALHFAIKLEVNVMINHIGNKLARDRD